MKNEKFIKDYCEIIDNCHGQRPDKLWLATWMSCKSPYFSFPQNFEKFWSTGALPTDIRFSEKIFMALRLFLTLVSIVLKSIYIKITMRTELAQLYALRGKKINLMRTFAYNSNPQAEDPFWGKLVDLLTESSTPLVTVYDPHFSIKECKKAFQKNKKNVPYLAFFSPLEVVKCYFELLFEAFSNIHLSSQNKRIEHYLTAAYQQEILSPATFINLVFLSSFKKIINTFSIEKAYLPFENNPWEKMFYLAKKGSHKNFKVIGFQHSSIQEGATNYLLSAYETKNKFCPDRIMSVGSYTLDYMKGLPFYKNITLEIGCALRYSYLEQISFLPTERSDDQIHLLAILDGTPDTIKLISLVLEFCKTNPFKNISIKIKQHPSLPIKSFFPNFLTNAAVLNHQIGVAEGNLETSLIWADLILYSGTTSCIEALKMGKAVINYNHSTFNYDPLFQFTEFKWEVSNPQNLTAAIQQYITLSPKELQQKKIVAKKFVNSYFSPCTKENIERFL
jgi:surface carbohydrate biosynthesis protein (TIGR04326 family)